jgi:hypothetical protein
MYTNDVMRLGGQAITVSSAARFFASARVIPSSPSGFPGPIGTLGSAQEEPRDRGGSPSRRAR